MSSRHDAGNDVVQGNTFSILCMIFYYNFKKSITKCVGSLRINRPRLILISFSGVLYHFLESKIANARHPAMAIPQPMILGVGNVSP